MSILDRDHLANILGEIEDELIRATEKFGPFNSTHEGYAVLLEEFDEMWQEIKHGTPERMREEAVQVAAMAVRLIHDSDVNRG